MEDYHISKKALAHIAKDPIMKQLIAAITPKVNTSIGDVYADLLSSIVSQQISVKAARAIYLRFLDLYDGETPTPEMLVNTEYDTLRSVGLSNQKTTYMQNIARYWIDQKLLNQDWNSLNDQEIIKQLIQIKGVGEWTIQMILMFSLERPDVLPLDDLVIQLSMIKHYGIKAEKKRELKNKMTEIAESWAPYRTTACRYLWRARDL